MKFLIGITTQGSMSFISKGWGGGRTRDKYLTGNIAETLGSCSASCIMYSCDINNAGITRESRMDWIELVTL